MKITIDFENGMQVTLKPENVQLVDNHGKDTVLTFKTDHTLVPIMFFKSLLATPAELGLRNAALASAAKAVSEKAQKAAKAELQASKDEQKQASVKVALHRPLQVSQLDSPAVAIPVDSVAPDHTLPVDSYYSGNDSSNSEARRK